MVSLDPADTLFLRWTTSINAFGLFQEALAEQMAYRDIDHTELVALVGDALEPRERNLHDLESLLESTCPDTCSTDE